MKTRTTRKKRQKNGAETKDESMSRKVGQLHDEMPLKSSGLDDGGMRGGPAAENQWP